MRGTRELSPHFELLGKEAVQRTYFYPIVLARRFTYSSDAAFNHSCSHLYWDEFFVKSKYP